MHATLSRPTGARATVRAIAVTALAFLAATLSACSEKSQDQTPDAAAPPENLQVYTVRGEIEALPSETTDLRIHHEAIPEFIGPDGTVQGMQSMTMAFWPPQGLSLEDARIKDLDLTGLAPGDKVSFTFEVVHDPETNAIKGYYATAVKKLPPDTALDFSPIEETNAE